MNLAKALKTARDAAWMTQEELAANTTLTLSKIQGIEEGIIEHEYVNKQEMESLAAAFKIPCELLYILGYDDSDIAPGKKELADALLPSMQNLIKDLIADDKNKKG